MKLLAGEISRITIENYGTKTFLERLADPLFFQALGCALAYDWHSSGVTTTTCGALKEALSKEMGIIACGGKGKTSRKTINEIQIHGDIFSFSDSKITKLQKTSRLTAKVDSSCILDGYNLYHHSFLFDEKGNWTVIQQGMNGNTSYSRRYHWFNSEVFVDGPPTNIAGTREKEALNLVSGDCEESRKVAVDLVKDNPVHLRRYFDGQTTLFDNNYKFPARHEVLPADLSKKDWEMLNKAYELQPGNYEELVSLKGMGKKKLRALALLAKLIHGTKLDWKDPVKYSFAHGGKDGFPYPLDKQTYANSIDFLADAVKQTDLSHQHKSACLAKLAKLF